MFGYYFLDNPYKSVENYEPVRVFEVRSSHSELLWKIGLVAFTNMVHVGIITLGKIIEKKL